MGIASGVLRKTMLLFASLSSILAAVGAFLSPWYETMPFRSLFGVWVARIAVPLFGGTLGTAVGPDSFIWIASLFAAALCMISLSALLLPVRGILKKVTLIGGVAGLAGGIGIGRAFQLARASDAFGAWHAVALLSSFLFGASLLMVGLMIDAAAHSRTPKAVRALRICLIAAGGAVASFVLLPVGTLLLAVSLLIAAFVVGSSAFGGVPETSLKTRRLSR
jgi:hypothetical protein